MSRPQFPRRTPAPTPAQLRALREGAGLSRPAFGRLIGVSEFRIEHWESARSPVPIGLYALARARLALHAGRVDGALAILAACPVPLPAR